MGDIQVLEVIRNEIQAEHTLISHRLGWYIGAVSLLMTAFAIALSGGHTRTPFFAKWMPRLGLLLSFLALCAIVPAVWVQYDLLKAQRSAIESARTRLLDRSVNAKITEEKRHDAKDELARLNDYARVTCPDRQTGFVTHWVAMSAPVLIPAIFLVTWWYGRSTPVNWKQQVAGCFGAADLKWGSHGNDQQRARDMLKAAIDAGAPMTEIVAEVEAFLQGKGAQPQHVQAQVDKVRNLSF